jgi:ATP synthase protein I
MDSLWDFASCSSGCRFVQKGTNRRRGTGDMPEPKPSPRRSGSDGRSDREDQQWFRMVGIGFEFIAAVLVFAALGWWLDGRLGTEPWLMVAGVALGFGVGLWLMIQAAMKTFHD